MVPRPLEEKEASDVQDVWVPVGEEGRQEDREEEDGEEKKVAGKATQSGAS